MARDRETLLGNLLRTRWAIYDSTAEYPGAVQAGFAFFAEWAFDMSVVLDAELGDCAKLFACDELQKLIDGHNSPWPLDNLLQTGRRWGLEAIFCTQAPNLIHNSVRGQINEWVMFKTTSRNAMAVLAAEEDGVNVEEIRDPPKGAYVIVKTDTGAESRGRVF